ncbi:DUF3862 domain-containing protein [Paenibacillus sp. NPDC057934]|uniref:DUF3862 domain-containing protein n=1 Tax=Paenibacillus sp. NPDC057934 TaxID=3346282 RepID=UPI0036D77356
MWLFIEIIGFLAAIIFAIMGIVAKLRKKDTMKRNFIIAIAAFVLFIIGAVNLGADNEPAEVAKESASPASAAPTVEPTANPTVPPATEKPKATEPSDEAWQKSFRKIALNEAGAYIEIKVKGTMTNDLIKSRSGVIKQQADKITNDDKGKFMDLAAAVAADDTENVKKIYTELGGEDFPELHKAAKPVVAKEEPTKENPPTITKSEYEKIENGMSYKKVQQIIGGPGEVLSEGGEKGTEFYTIMVVYYGEGSLGANANFMFQGDKLLNKAQLGLK